MKKINIYGVDRNGGHWYIGSTNSFKTCSAALQSYVKIHGLIKDVETMKRNVFIFNPYKVRIIPQVDSRIAFVKIYASYKD